MGLQTESHQDLQTHGLWPNATWRRTRNFEGGREWCVATLYSPTLAHLSCPLFSFFQNFRSFVALRDPEFVGSDLSILHDRRYRTHLREQGRGDIRFGQYPPSQCLRTAANRTRSLRLSPSCLTRTTSSWRETTTPCLASGHRYRGSGVFFPSFKVVLGNALAD